ncbi:MAG: T9SS type A sorting domain-containing protein [Calditrichae bacterium]|nr:T9SS type A sorting domain-containing protein [Calditrichota bacterium]MCB9058547.1 T9SS type A sorting domain-containing protein [Calditrichia bacterium]
MKRLLLLLFPVFLFSGILLAQNENIVVPYILKAPGEVVVDGYLDEWAFAFPLDHSQKSMPDSGRFNAENPGWYIADPYDCSGTIYMMYDDDYLYFAADVRDDEPGHFSDVSWAADAVEIYWGNWDVGDAIIPPPHDPGMPDDAVTGDYALQITISFDASLDTTSLMVWAFGTTFNEDPNAVSYRIWDLGDGYTLEGRLSLAALESPTTGNTMSFTPGTRIPMTWSLYDIDETESSADFQGFAYTPKGYAGWMGAGPGWQVCDVLETPRGMAWNDNADFDFVHPYIKRAVKPVEVDGMLDEWSYAFHADHWRSSIPDSGRFNAENPGWFPASDEDLKGTIMTMYDDEYLYFAAHVQDDEPGHFSDVSWAADAVEFYWGNWDIGSLTIPDEKGMPNDATTGDYALQITVSFDESLDTTSLMVWGEFAQTFNEDPNAVAYTIWDDGAGYDLEGRLSLAALESPTTGNTLDFTEGYRIPFTWSLYDIDETENSADFQGLAYTPKGYAAWMGAGPGWQYVDVKGGTFIDYINDNYPNLTALEDQQISLVPSKFNLQPNYPNPFNPTTRIAFSMEKASRVDLKIFDVTGKLVKTILNNELRTAGSYEVTVDMNGYSSGVYFAELSNGAERLQQKMLLVK